MLRLVLLYLLSQRFTQCEAMGSGSSGGSDWRYFAAGGTSAAFSHGITTPLDVVKTRMQLNPTKYNGDMIAATKDIIRTEGVKMLAQGLAPTVIGYGIEGALKFGFYEAFKPLFAELTPSEFLNFFLAGVIAGAVASVVLCPAEDARIRLVSEPTFADGLVQALNRLVREDGFASIFAGLQAMLAKQIPYTATKQLSFDFFTSALYEAYEKRKQVIDMTDSEKLGIVVGAAALTSVLSCVTSQPGDVILTETYRSHCGESFGDVISNIYKQSNGFNGFFSGLKARVIHVGGIITTQLVVYDKTKQFLGLSATGSH